MARVLVKSIAIPAYNEGTDTWTIGLVGSAATQTIWGSALNVRKANVTLPPTLGTGTIQTIASGNSAGNHSALSIISNGAGGDGQSTIYLGDYTVADRTGIRGGRDGIIYFKTESTTFAAPAGSIIGNGNWIVGTASIVSNTFHIVRGNCGIAFTNLPGSVGIGSNFNQGTTRNFNRLTTTTNGGAVLFDANVSSASAAISFFVQPPGGSVGGTTGAIQAGGLNGLGEWDFGTANEVVNVVHVFNGPRGNASGDYKHTTLRVQGAAGQNSLAVVAVGSNTVSYTALIMDRSTTDSYLWFSQNNSARFRFVTTTNDTWFTSGAGLTGQAGYAELGAIGKTGGWEFGNASAANIGILLRGSDAGYTASALKYYQEGSFNPTFTFSTPGSSSSTTQGYYVRIGRLVQFQAFIQSIVTTGASGGATLTLPFAGLNAGNCYVTCVFGLTNNVSVLDKGLANPNTSVMSLLRSDGVTSIVAADFGGSAYFAVTVTYMIN